MTHEVDPTRLTATSRPTDPTPTDPPRHVVLLGMMGAGKTRTGAALSVRLRWPLLDGDAGLEAQEGRTGARIAETDGVDHLHRLEEQLLLDSLTRDQPAVIAPAACVVEDDRCVEAMRAHATVVWLDLPADQLEARTHGGAHRRAMDPTEVQELLERRRPRFAAAADLHLDATAATDELVAQVVAHLDDQIGGRPDRGSPGAIAPWSEA